MRSPGSYFFVLAVTWFTGCQIPAFAHFLLLADRVEAATYRVVARELMPMFRTVGWEAMVGLLGGFACFLLGVMFRVRHAHAERYRRES